jgi:hypothetical protein
MNKIQKTLIWITGILNEHQIPYQITGGLAAHSYGATRPINDIDIDIPEDRFAEILDEVKPFIIYGPARYRNKVWDLDLMTLNYEGQEIDIGGAYDVKIMDEKTGEWHKYTADLGAGNLLDVSGVKAKVAPKEDLIRYKSWLAMPGDHQERDVREMMVGEKSKD